VENNQNSSKLKINYGDFDSLTRVNELNKHSLISVYSQLNRVENTKAWKVMCGLRRLNEQFIKGSKSEKRKFVRYVKNKILNKPINQELELSRFSPINSGDIKIHEFEVIQSNIEENDTSNLQEVVNYVTYNVPKNFDVFRFPVIEWDFRWQRPQQIASQFADHGHRVFYFSIDTESAPEDSSYDEVVSKIQIRELRTNVWWVKLCSCEALNAYRSTISDKNLLFLNWSLDYLKQKFNIAHSISIIDLPFWTPVVIELANNINIYDCMDDHSGFSTNSETMLLQEAELFKKSDLVVTSSQTLNDKVAGLNENTVIVRNAGEYDYFSVPPQKISKDIVSRKGPIIGYYGAISEWFDIKLIEQLAKRNKNWTFILVGDTFGADIDAANKLSNVIFTGEKPYSELTEYLYGFDVCLIPFIVNNLTLSTNPVKVYEYLAAGKPVVSSDLPELQILDGLVSLATTVEDFELAINASLADQESNKNTRMKFAQENSWKARYLQLNDEITNRFFPKVSIVIVTYNNWSYTKQCLNSLFENSNYPNLEIIVVDNASQDESRIELSRIIHPQFKVILSPINEGFAGGNNRGIRESTGDYIILLNNDTIVPFGWVEKLIKPLQEDDNLGMVGPMSNSVGNDQMLDFFIGNGFDGPNVEWLNEFYSMYDGRIHATDLLGFFCVAIKREVYDKVGELDTHYGLGMFEDDDYCERVREAGYNLAIVEDSFVYHHGSVSFKKLEDEKYRSIFVKNKTYFERKWNKVWVNPKHPRTIFYNLFDSTSIKEALNNLYLKKVLIVGQLNWSQLNDRHQQLAKLLANDEVLVINHALNYYDTSVVGTRKLGPTLYLSNRIDLFVDVNFDMVIISGKDADIKNTLAKHKIVDAFSTDFISDDTEILKLDFKDVEELKREICTKL